MLVVIRLVYIHVLRHRLFSLIGAFLQHRYFILLHMHDMPWILILIQIRDLALYRQSPWEHERQPSSSNFGTLTPEACLVGWHQTFPSLFSGSSLILILIPLQPLIFVSLYLGSSTVTDGIDAQKLPSFSSLPWIRFPV